MPLIPAFQVVPIGLAIIASFRVSLKNVDVVRTNAIVALEGRRKRWLGRPSNLLIPAVCFAR